MDWVWGALEWVIWLRCSESGEGGGGSCSIGWMISLYRCCTDTTVMYLERYISVNKWSVDIQKNWVVGVEAESQSIDAFVGDYGK